MKNAADLTRIDRSIEIAAPPERVWQALTTAEEISVWFQMNIEGAIRPGANIWMTVTAGPPEYVGARFPVYIIEMTPPSRLVWEWHPGDPSIDVTREPRTTVTFTLEPSARGTKLTVSETGFEKIPLERRAKALADNTQGWADVVIGIQRYVEKAR